MVELKSFYLSDDLIERVVLPTAAPVITMPPPIVKDRIPDITMPAFPLFFANHWQLGEFKYFFDIGQGRPTEVKFDSLEQEYEHHYHGLSRAVGNLNDLEHGRTTEYTQFVTKTESTTYLNGRPRLRPRLTTYECPYEHSIYPVVARPALHAEITTRMKRLGELRSHEKSTWKCRAALIQVLTGSPDTSLTVTWNPTADRDSPACHLEWENFLIGNRRYFTSNTVAPEIGQFFAGPFARHFLDRTNEFKWVYRRGFIDELHCPREYWRWMRFWLQGIDVRNEGVKGLFVNGEETDAYVSWRSFPFQPITRVILSDVPDAPPIKTKVYTNADWGETRPYLPDNFISYDSKKTAEVA